MKVKVLATALLTGAVLVGAAAGAHHVQASDHDDGTSPMKSQNTNLTDLLVFTEKSQNSSVKSDDMIFVMYVNPRSVAGQQYHFATNARYEFHVSRVNANADAPTTKDDVVLRYEFGAPDQNRLQRMLVTAVRDGQTMTAERTIGNTAISTTPIDQAPINNNVQMDGKTMTVFAGTREDTFFFDLESFLRVRTSAAERFGGSTKPQEMFKSRGNDFTIGYNVLAIISRVPRAFLQGSTQATSFDVWETVSVKQ